MAATQRQKQILRKKFRPEQIEEQISRIWSGAKFGRDVRNLAVFSALFASAVAGRVAMQWVPSVEPIIPLAILAGMLFGMKEGATLGAGAYVVSNFMVWGIQGPWTIFQALGAGAAGLLGGAVGKLRTPSTRDLVVLSVVGTMIFEIIMNISGAAFGLALFGVGLIGLPLYLLASLPFSAVHTVTNAAFARLFAPLLKLRRSDDELKVVSLTRHTAGAATNVRMYRARPE